MSSNEPLNTNANASNPKRICIAKIATAHGIKGLVKLHVFADDITLVKGNLFTGETGDKTLHITPKNKTAKHWLAEVYGITDRNAAEDLRGTELYINQTALPEINADEFYYSDLIGLPTFDKNGIEIGEIIAVENFGASDLIDIKPKAAPSFYLPVTDETLLEIKADRVIIAIPEGLLE